MDPHHRARLEAKTASQQFTRMLQQDFNLAPKIAQVIVQEAELYLNQQSQPLKVGQIRVVLAQRHIHPVRDVTQTPTVNVTWTLDAGAEDLAVLDQHGAQRLRQVRIQRLLAEALEQGAIATQEDLARTLSVSVRTIKRDFANLHAEGCYLPSRGYLHGVGRSQTHKARIVKLWLQGMTYDQIAAHTHHSLTSIQRYILTFVRVVHLHQQQFEPADIAHLAQLGLGSTWPCIWPSIVMPPSVGCRNSLIGCCKARKRGLGEILDLCRGAAAYFSSGLHSPARKRVCSPG